jgi:hypothetical protein
LDFLSLIPDPSNGWEPTVIAAAIFQVSHSFAIPAGFDSPPRTFTFAGCYLLR